MHQNEDHTDQKTLFKNNFCLYCLCAYFWSLCPFFYKNFLLCILPNLTVVVGYLVQNYLKGRNFCGKKFSRILILRFGANREIKFRETQFFFKFSNNYPNFLILGQNWPTFEQKIRQIAKLNSCETPKILASNCEIKFRENFSR